MTDYIPYDITVSESDPWMQRRVQVTLTTQLTERTSAAQSFTLDFREAKELSDKLINFLKEAYR